MDENQEILTEEKPKKNRALPLFIILFLASLGLNLFLFFKYAQNGVKIQEQNRELSMLYKAADFKADSLQKELDMVSQQLLNEMNSTLAQKDLKAEIKEELEIKRDELIAASAEISRLIAQSGDANSFASNGSNNKALLEAKSKIDDLEQTNTEYLEKAEESQKQYIIAKKEAEQNAIAAEEFQAKNDSLKDVTNDLNKKLSRVSTLNIAGLNVVAVRQKKDKEEITDRASKAERLKINFSLLPSEPSEQEKKEITIRIIEPNGVVLAKNTESLTDSEDIFTLVQSITYDGSEKGVTYYYDQEASYKKGVFKIEIYNNKRLLDRRTFSLR